MRQRQHPNVLRQHRARLCDLQNSTCAMDVKDVMGAMMLCRCYGNASLAQKNLHGKWLGLPTWSGWAQTVDGLKLCQGLGNAHNLLLHWACNAQLKVSMARLRTLHAFAGLVSWPSTTRHCVEPEPVATTGKAEEGLLLSLPLCWPSEAHIQWRLSCHGRHHRCLAHVRVSAESTIQSLPV